MRGGGEGGREGGGRGGGGGKGGEEGKKGEGGGTRVQGDGGVGLEVFVEGPDDGTPVLLMHGWPDTHNLWRNQVKALTDAGYRTIARSARVRCE